MRSITFSLAHSGIRVLEASKRTAALFLSADQFTRSTRTEKTTLVHWKHNKVFSCGATMASVLSDAALLVCLTVELCTSRIPRFFDVAVAVDQIQTLSSSLVEW